VEESLANIWEELINRQSGPLHFRFILQPLVASLLAVRAGRNDVRHGRPGFFRSIVHVPKERRDFLGEAWRDVGMLFFVGVALDMIYQLILFHRIQIGQCVVVAALLAIVPYAVVRSLTNRMLT
jgi:hypothetical protein